MRLGKMITFFENIFSGKILSERLRILHKQCRKRKKIKDNVIRDENQHGLAENIQWFSFSDLPFTRENSNTPETIEHTKNERALVAFQNTTTNTFQNNFIQQPDLREMLKRTFTHIFYYLYPSFLSYQGFIMWNYAAAGEKALNNWIFKKGISIVNLNLASNNFNSLELIMSQHLNQFCLSSPTEEKGQNGLLTEEIKTTKTTNSNDTYLKKLKKMDYKKKNNTSALKHLVAALLELPVEEAFATVKKHPKRFYVPLEEVKKTYIFLSEKNFSLEAIRDCSTILLYPKEKVEKTLNFLYETKVIENDSEEKYALHLCVYYMEKPFHFSGEGVFPSETTEKE